MSAFAVTVLYVLIWRLCVLACGIFTVYLGFRLFVSGLAAHEGSLEAGIGGSNLKLGNIAPGTFFALFGAAIIATLVWRSPAEIVIPKEALQASQQVDMRSAAATSRTNAAPAPDVSVDTTRGGIVVRGDK